MAFYISGILIVLSLVHYSLQDVRCYDCTEYDNHYDGPPASQSVNRGQSVNRTMVSRINEKLCHDLSSPAVVTSCPGDYCVKAVTEVDDNVNEIYRACSANLDCDNFSPPRPARKIKFCGKCKGDECNSTENIRASSLLMFLSFFTLVKNF